jgi:hypothetical protein
MWTVVRYLRDIHIFFLYVLLVLAYIKKKHPQLLLLLIILFFYRKFAILGFFGFVFIDLFIIKKYSLKLKLIGIIVFLATAAIALLFIVKSGRISFTDSLLAALQRNQTYIFSHYGDNLSQQNIFTLIITGFVKLLAMPIFFNYVSLLSNFDMSLSENLIHYSGRWYYILRGMGSLFTPLIVFLPILIKVKDFYQIYNWEKYRILYSILILGILYTLVYTIFRFGIVDYRLRVPLDVFSFFVLILAYKKNLFRFNYLYSAVIYFGYSFVVSFIYFWSYRT